MRQQDGRKSAESTFSIACRISLFRVRCAAEHHLIRVRDAAQRDSLPAHRQTPDDIRSTVTPLPPFADRASISPVHAPRGCRTHSSTGTARGRRISDSASRSVGRDFVSSSNKSPTSSTASGAQGSNHRHHVVRIIRRMEVRDDCKPNPPPSASATNRVCP